jgi:hypothetical protein
MICSLFELVDYDEKFVENLHMRTHMTVYDFAEIDVGISSFVESQLEATRDKFERVIQSMDLKLIAEVLLWKTNDPPPENGDSGKASNALKLICEKGYGAEECLNLHSANGNVVGAKYLFYGRAMTLLFSNKIQ